MVERDFWQKRIEEAWKQRSVIWLSGVRRVGKTCLAKSLRNVEYFDCELPRVRQQLQDPEAFLKDLRDSRIVLDEIHRLANPSEILKIAADHYPEARVLATGSSTLGASSKFRDTLTGRKSEIWLTPMVAADLEAFGNSNLRHRFHGGGMPEIFLAKERPERIFQEWMDAYWAKDIQELFRLERRHSFQQLAELLFVQSGSIFEATRFSRACEVSRPTVTNYLSVLEATYVVHVVRPFSSRRATEIISAPKVYGFDTGFVCYYRGWESLRSEDLGVLWEHYVLNELHGRLQTRSIHYWRDKRGHEVDFVLPLRRHAPVAVECKWSCKDFDPAGVKAFSRRYPDGLFLVVARDVDRPHSSSFGGITVRFVDLDSLIRQVLELSGSSLPE